jgi:primosomal protein N' (replication factor Y) (superfamily II helicase)
VADAPAVYARVCVDVAPAHLDRPFDYRVPAGRHVAVGQRVRVSFAGRRRTGWVLAVADAPATDPGRVRELDAVEGDHTWFGASDLATFRWVAERFAGTLADVLRHALPPRVAAVEREASTWGAPAATSPALRPPCPTSAWRAYAASGLLRAAASPERLDPAPAFWWRALPGEDDVALLCDLVARCLAAGRSALVLAPDRAAPLPDAVLELAGSAAADLRAEGQRDRYRAFLRCRSGHARVAVGERSAAFAPLRDLGLVIVADEASPAYKERRAPRHHSREVALARGRFAGATTVLTGDVPSPRLWRLLRDGHVTAAHGHRGEERERAPLVEVADRSTPGRAWRRLGDLPSRRIGEAVARRGAAVVVAARGGEGAALACRACGARRRCPVCDGSLRPARDARPDWDCPACGWADAPFPCATCGADDTAPLAAGAGRLARELARAYPEAEVARMEGFDAPGPRRRPAIGVLTRGSVVIRPGWLGAAGADVVVLPDADAFLRRAAFDAAEDALRLWFAVARWAGRVVLETREPAHPAVQALVRWDPEGFWHSEADRRAALAYPPAASLVLVRAPADELPDVSDELRAALPPDCEVLGPGPGGALLVKTPDLRGTLAALKPLRHAWSNAGRGVRVDVDPVAAG